MVPTHFSLALGGWAARWLAHIGIIRYLEENGLRAEEVSGTSMGSIIAALYAFGKTSGEMRTICSEIKYAKLIDLDMKKWLLKGNKIRKLLESIFWDAKMEDAKIPLKIVSTNISTWEKRVFASGPVVDAIRSSISIPGIIMPNVIWEEQLVDGGIINNLPVEVLGGKNAIAVSVLRDVSRPIDTKLKILGFEINHSIFWISYQILQKSIDIMVNQNEKKSLESPKNIVLLEPKFPGIDYYEFHKFEQIIGIWYATASEIGLMGKISEKFK